MNNKPSETQLIAAMQVVLPKTKLIESFPEAHRWAQLKAAVAVIVYGVERCGEEPTAVFRDYFSLEPDCEQLVQLFESTLASLPEEPARPTISGSSRLNGFIENLDITKKPRKAQDNTTKEGVKS